MHGKRSNHQYKCLRTASLHGNRPKILTRIFRSGSLVYGRGRLGSAGHSTPSLNGGPARASLSLLLRVIHVARNFRVPRKRPITVVIPRWSARDAHQIRRIDCIVCGAGLAGAGSDRRGGVWCLPGGAAPLPTRREMPGTRKALAARRGKKKATWTKRKKWPSLVVGRQRIYRKTCPIRTDRFPTRPEYREDSANVCRTPPSPSLETIFENDTWNRCFLK